MKIMLNNYSAQRFLQLQKWINELGINGSLIPLKGDASFRRYYRIATQARKYIIMDAPPDRENCEPYIAIAHQLRLADVCVPEILATDLTNGFLLLSDFGDHLLWEALTFHSADFLYQEGFKTLIKIQSNLKNFYPWPDYNKDLYWKELMLFKEWFVEKFKQITLSSNQEQLLFSLFNILIDDALSQPQVCVHRDYHSRNLMLVPFAESFSGSPACFKNQKFLLGVLDFQDAVWGPITYDLVSILKDCYIEWPEEKVKQWALNYHQLALTSGVLTVDNPQLFLRWLDWIGLQRHLKCLGIFSRLYLLYEKPNYLQYIPRTLNYAKAICHRYVEFKSLVQLLDYSS